MGVVRLEENILTGVLAGVGDKLPILVLQGPDGRLLVDRVVVYRLRGVGFTIGRVNAARDEAPELEAVGGPDPVWETVRSFSGQALDHQLG